MLLRRSAESGGKFYLSVAAGAREFAFARFLTKFEVCCIANLHIDRWRRNRTVGLTGENSTSITRKMTFWPCTVIGETLGWLVSKATELKESQSQCESLRLVPRTFLSSYREAGSCFENVLIATMHRALCTMVSWSGEWFMSFYWFTAVLF